MNPTIFPSFAGAREATDAVLIHRHDFSFGYDVVDQGFDFQQLLSRKLLRSVDAIMNLRLGWCAFSAGFVGRIILPRSSLFCRNQRRAANRSDRQEVARRQRR